jgi:hypothetical protein
VFAKSSIEAALEKEIAAQLEKLSQTQDTQEYDAIVDRIAKLQKLKSEESGTNLAVVSTKVKLESDRRMKPPSMDSVLYTGANIFGILWLARYEKEHVIKAQKALGFVMKPR